MTALFTPAAPSSDADPAAAGRSTPPAAIKPLRVGELLLDRGIISQEQIDQALAYQQKRGHAKLLGEVLVELEIVCEEQVMEVLAEEYGIPFARLSPELIDPKVTDVLAREFCQRQACLPLFLVEGVLTVAVHEPANVFLVEEIERETGHAVQIVAATSDDIRDALDHNRVQDDVFVIDDIVGESDLADMAFGQSQEADLGDLESAASDSPVIKLVNYIIYTAVHETASDIHIEPDDGVLRVRYRVDGQLFQKMTPPHAMLNAVVSRIKIMGGLDISERRMPQDGGITVMVERRPVDLRVSTMPGKFGEKVVIRIIDKKNALTELDKLGFGAEMLEGWRSLTRQPNGIVLVTGPTGSGKSTTLYSTLAEISCDHLNSSTVEDPVEYNLAGVNQFQTNNKAGFTFANALRALLRQDPDVIMVGEIRDQETAKTATQAALTGHLVLSTLHTNDAPSAVTRLFNIGVESYLVAASVRGVLAQRLVRKICTHCREPLQITPQMRGVLAKLTGGGSDLETVYHGAGCPRCRHTGYAGRAGLYELYMPDDASLDAISRGATLQELRQLAHESGCHQTLKSDGLEKVAAGVTTVDELLTAIAA